MAFQEDSITFASDVPRTFENIRLTGVTYRRSMLDITVRGLGMRVTRFALDGPYQARPHIGATLAGPHTVDIELDDPLRCLRSAPKTRCSV
jgi:hypothetical protein